MGKIKYFVKAGFTLISAGRLATLSQRRSSDIRRKFGFTLIELLIVIAILGILAAAVMIAINPNKRMQEARDATRLADTSQISESIAEYYVTHGTYPPDPTISAETEFASDEGPNWIPGLDNLPQDPNQAGIISTLASLFDMKQNTKSTHHPVIKAQIAGTHSITIDAKTTGFGMIRFKNMSNPSDYNNCINYSNFGMGQEVGQWFDGYYSAQRAYLTFDTSTLPSNSQITSVTLNATNISVAPSVDFILNVRQFDFANSIDCPPTDDWGGDPPTSSIIGTFDTSNLLSPNNSFSITINDTSAINKSGGTKFMLSSNREEQNIAPQFIQDEHFWFASPLNPTASYRPQLIIEYTVPSFSPPPESPPPSPPPKGCKSKKKIYCYLVPLDRKSAVLWAVLENEDDERIYSKETANCKETPPAETFLNYCIKDP